MTEIYYVGLQDRHGNICWLAGYKGGDPARCYTFRSALRFKTRGRAEGGIKRAKKTHPYTERRYEIFTLSDFKPGARIAINAGCKCPVIDNGHGRGYMGQPGVFVYSGECPLHK